MSEQFDKLNHWYGWNCGECPVHPETVIETFGENGLEIQMAKRVRWNWVNDIDGFVAFRIVKLYVEPKRPREWWINVYPDDLDGCSYTTREKANEEHASNRLECVRVREVLPEDEA